MRDAIIATVEAVEDEEVMFLMEAIDREIEREDNNLFL